MPRKSNKSQSSRTVRANARDESTTSVRIIGGSLRRRLLECAGDPRTRPMKDRVREAVFNLLGDVAGAIAIDLFAGTGALGFEAISRGAKAAVFFEQHFPTADAIRRNAATLAVADNCQVLAGDTFVWFARQGRLRELPDDGPWVVFCSPPYSLYVSRRDDLLHVIGQLWEAAPRQSVFVIEADERFDFALLPETGGWDIRSYPPAYVGLAWKN